MTWSTGDRPERPRVGRVGAVVAHQEELAVGDVQSVCSSGAVVGCGGAAGLVGVEVRLVERDVVDVDEAVVADLDRVAAPRRSPA